MKHYFCSIMSVCLVCLTLAACRIEPRLDAVFEDGFIRGHYAYVPFETEILTIEISDPQAPKILDRINLEFRVIETTVDGEHLYVGRSADSALENQVKTDGGVFKYNISNGSPEFEEQLTFPAFVRTLSAESNQLIVSGLERTWAINSEQSLASVKYKNYISYSYNEFIWQDGFLLGGGGFCSFRTGHCQGWLDKIVIGDESEILAERLYAGSIPIFAMEIVGDRLVTHGRNIMMAPLNDLESFPVDQVEYAGGSYSGVSAAVDDQTFYFAENHEILVRQFNEQGPLPQLVGRESSAPIGTFFTHMSVKDNYLYAVSSYGLHIIDVSDPQVPFGIAFLPLGNSDNNNFDQPLPQPSKTPAK